MTDSEYRALIGDRLTQGKFTEKGIPLRCPLCRGPIKVSKAGHTFYCYSCNFTLTFPTKLSKQEALKRWNTRPTVFKGYYDNKNRLGQRMWDTAIIFE